MPTPLILDVDTGVDDMVALLFAVASPEVELVAATCVTGNVHVDTVTRNTSLVLELAGAGDVESRAARRRRSTAGGSPSRWCTVPRGWARTSPVTMRRGSRPAAPRP